MIYEGRVDVRVIDWKREWEAAGDVRKGMEWFGVSSRAWVWNRTWKVSWKETIITNWMKLLGKRRVDRFSLLLLL